MIVHKKEEEADITMIKCQDRMENGTFNLLEMVSSKLMKKISIDKLPEKSCIENGVLNTNTANRQGKMITDNTKTIPLFVKDR